MSEKFRIYLFDKVSYTIFCVFYTYFVQGGAMHVDSGKFDAKGSHFFQNKVGREFVNRDGKNCISGNFLAQSNF